MITAKTKSGFEIVLEESSLDNMELVDTLDEMNEGNPLAISRLVPLLLGKEGKKKLYDHLRTPEGRVPSTAVEREIIELMVSIQPGKNSSSSPN